MASTNDLRPVAEAEQLSSAADVNDDTIGAMFTVVSDDATSLETVNITMAGDGALANLKAPVRGTGGSLRRWEFCFLAVEGEPGAGKTHTASLIDVLLELAARATADKLGLTQTVKGIADGWPACRACQEVLTAFEEERVAVLNFDLTSGSDGITLRDVMPDFEPGMALGIRLAARGLFNVSTEELRAKLRPLPAGVESFFHVGDVWPLVCQRLRMAHGLAADSSADAARLLLVCTFDEFQSVGRNLQKDFGYTEPAAKSCCRDFQQCLADLVVADDNKTSPAAKHGPLSLDDSRLVFEREVLQKLQWAGPRAQSEAFFHRLAAMPAVLATLDLAGGIPAVITEAAKTLAVDKDLSRCMQDMMLENDISAPRLASFTALWRGKWMTMPARAISH
ncbi:g4150 [Coccomyxa elongata]